MKPPVATPGAGKAYSIEKGTFTLYIKSKTDMIGYSLGGIVPRVSNNEGVAVRLERITEGYLPRCKPTLACLHLDVQPRRWAREKDIPNPRFDSHGFELSSCARVTVATVRAMVDGRQFRMFSRH